MWREIKKYLSNSDDNQKDILCGGILHTDPKQAANALNHFFVESITEIKASIPDITHVDCIGNISIISELAEFNEVHYASFL